MYTRVDRFFVVKGCSVYTIDDNGIVSPRPIIDDAEVTLPQITHPTTTASSMGNIEVVDQTRLEAMTCTIKHDLGINVSQRESIIKSGVSGVYITWAEEVRRANGTFDLEGFSAKIKGMVQSHGGNSLNIGDNPAADLTINTYGYQLLQGSNVIYNIDQLTGVLEINGVNYREKLNNLL